jgi:hypothetical protein
MTLPDERYRAVLFAKKFLEELMDRNKTPRIPKNIRDRAYSILRHYPSEWDMQRAAMIDNTVFAERMEPLHRLVKGYEQSKQQENAREENWEVSTPLGRIDRDD